MKKYLLTLCLTMLAVVSSWAQWAIDVSTAPVYVEVNNGNVGAGGTPNVREFTITTPDGKTFGTDFTIQAMEAAPTDVTPGSIATAGTVTHVSDNKYSVTFSPATVGSSVGITKFYIVMKEGDNIVSSTAATPFEVNVFDKTKARFLVNPGNQIVDKGKSNNEIVISLAPVSAGVTVTLTDDNGDDYTGPIHINTASPFKTPMTADDITNNIVRLVVDASSAAKGDHVKVKITPNGNPKDRYGNDIPAIEFTVTVDLPELPVGGVTKTYYTFNVGTEFGSPLNTTDFPAGATYKEEYVCVPVAGYRKDVAYLTNAESHDAMLHTEHAGMIQVKGTFTPTGETANSYRTWERILNVMVLPTQMKLSSFKATSSDNGATWTLQSEPTVSYATTVDEDKKPTPAINYTLEGVIPETAL